MTTAFLQGCKEVAATEVRRDGLGDASGGEEVEDARQRREEVATAIGCDGFLKMSRTRSRRPSGRERVEGVESGEGFFRLDDVRGGGGRGKRRRRRRLRVLRSHVGDGFVRIEVEAVGDEGLGSLTVLALLS